MPSLFQTFEMFCQKGIERGAITDQRGLAGHFLSVILVFENLSNHTQSMEANKSKIDKIVNSSSLCCSYTGLARKRLAWRQTPKRTELMHAYSRNIVKSISEKRASILWEYECSLVWSYMFPPPMLTGTLF